MALNGSDGWRATTVGRKRCDVSTASNDPGLQCSYLAGDGGNPCSYCDKHDQKCYTSSKRRLKDKSLDAEAMAQRLAKLESLLRSSVDSPPEASSHPVQSTATSHLQNRPGDVLISPQLPLQNTVYYSPSEPHLARPDANIGIFGQTQGML